VIDGITVYSKRVAALPFEFGGINTYAVSPDGKVLVVAGDEFDRSRLGVYQGRRLLFFPAGAGRGRTSGVERAARTAAS
jgi:hypothetical protein